MMFKNEVGLVPKPISQLFTKNNEYHDCDKLRRDEMGLMEFTRNCNTK